MLQTITKHGTLTVSAKVETLKTTVTVPTSETVDPSNTVPISETASETVETLNTAIFTETSSAGNTYYKGQCIGSPNE